jgi:rhodanese-related sulfurtransferase
MKYKVLIAIFVPLGLGAGVYTLSGSIAKDTMYTSLIEPTEVENTAPKEVPVLALAPEEFAQEAHADTRTIIDVRTQAEFDEGHLPGAQLLDFYAEDFAERIATLDRDAPYALYCRSGNRSGQTLTLMESLGFTNVLHLKGGVQAWQHTGYSTCTEC